MRLPPWASLPRRPQRESTPACPSPPTAMSGSSGDGTTPSAVTSPKATAHDVVGMLARSGWPSRRSETTRPSAPSDRGAEPTRRPATDDRSLDVGDKRPDGRRRDEPSVRVSEQVGAPERPDGPEMVQDHHQPEFGHVEDGVNVKVVLRGLVLARIQGRPEDGQRAESGDRRRRRCARGCSSTPDREGRRRGRFLLAGCCAPRRRPGRRLRGGRAG